MLQVVSAFHYGDRAEKGGSTYPWIVNCVDNTGEVGSYIVKLFTERQNNQQCAVAKEVYGNVLAGAFDLSVPEAVLVELSEGFISSLGPKEREDLKGKDSRIKFASAEAKGMPILNINTPSINLRHYDMAAVFAFDCLIWNIDRGGHRKKPNMLVNDQEFLLIDHEQILFFADNPERADDSFITKFFRGEIRYNYELHVLYPYLKNLQNSKKNNIFDTFFEYLARLNVGILDKYALQLERYGHPTGNVMLVKEYLSSVKRNTDQFSRMLNQAIS